MEYSVRANVPATVDHKKQLKYVLHADLTSWLEAQARGYTAQNDALALAALVNVLAVGVVGKLNSDVKYAVLNF